jgi:hypothetical protein
MFCRAKLIASVHNRLRLVDVDGFTLEGYVYLVQGQATQLALTCGSICIVTHNVYKCFLNSFV